MSARSDRFYAACTAFERARTPNRPSREQYQALRLRRIAKLTPSQRAKLNAIDGQEQHSRRVLSQDIARVLRHRGWLTPENEGYAPGSWAAKGTK